MLRLQHFESILGTEQGGKIRFLVDTFEVANESLQDPDSPPDLSEFLAIQGEYRDIFRSVMEANDLDALVFPQMLTRTPTLQGDQTIQASTVDAINILGAPGITVPGGYYENGAPFGLIFLGDLFSEAELLAYAYDYEQATEHRVAPNLLHVADIDRDGKVDFADFLVLSSNFGRRRGGTHRGDLNADRLIDFADFLILSNSFGYGAADAISVPEPLTTFRSLVVFFAVTIRTRRRRKVI